MFDLLLYIFLILVLQSTLVMMTCKDMGRSYTDEPNGMKLLTEQFVVQESVTNADELEEWTHCTYSYTGRLLPK